MSDRAKLINLLMSAQHHLAAPLPLNHWSTYTAESQSRVSEVIQEAEAIQRPLVILLLGGTGVGKSTLLNAFAKVEVAGASHDRRAFTRHFNIYHHSDVHLQGLKIPAPFEQHSHKIDSLKDKIILDAPDVDSTITLHRERVLSILPHVDIVIYLTTWQKYKDRRIHELLNDLKGAHTFVFVLNQIDRVRAHDREELKSDFVMTLQESGFSNPIVLGISAQRAIDRAYLKREQENTQAEEPEEQPDEQALDVGEFDRLETLLHEELMRAEVQSLKERSLVLRAIHPFSLLPSRIGYEGTLLELNEALSDHHDKLRALTEEIRTEIHQELKTLSQVYLRGYARQNHRVRDRSVGGPYGLFLKLQEWSVAKDVLLLDGWIDFESKRHAQRSQVTLSKGLESVRGELWTTSFIDSELKHQVYGDAGDHLLKDLNQHLEEHALSHTPSQRSAWLLNFLPISVCIATFFLFIISLWRGGDLGIGALIVATIILFSTCYTQFKILERVDQLFFERQSGVRGVALSEMIDRQPLFNALSELTHSLSQSREHIRKMVGIVDSLQELKQELHDQVLPSLLQGQEIEELD